MSRLLRDAHLREGQDQGPLKPTLFDTPADGPTQDGQVIAARVGLVSLPPQPLRILGEVLTTEPACGEYPLAAQHVPELLARVDDNGVVRWRAVRLRGLAEAFQPVGDLYVQWSSPKPRIPAEQLTVSERLELPEMPVGEGVA